MKHSEKIDAIKTSKPMRLTDIIYLSVLAVIIGVLLFFTYCSPFAKPGASVTVRTQENAYTFDLSGRDDGAHIIEDKLTVVIANGTVYVKDAKCSDHVCERFGKINRVHEVIVCAPQGIVVKISGESPINGVVR